MSFLSFLSHSPHLLSQGTVVLMVASSDNESSADNESQACMSRTPAARVGLSGGGTPFLQDAPSRVSAGFLSALWSATFL